MRKIRSGTKKKCSKNPSSCPSSEFAPISPSLDLCCQNTHNSTVSLSLSSLCVTDRWFLLLWRTGGEWGWNWLKGRGHECGFASISHSTTVLLAQSDLLGGCWHAGDDKRRQLLTEFRRGQTWLCQRLCYSYYYTSRLPGSFLIH